jgi:hypothetical protein
VYLFLGTAAGVPTSWSTVINGPASSAFGFSIAGIGDFNGDGLDDFVVGANSAAAYNGAAYIYFGRSAWAASLDTSAANVTLTMNDPSSTFDDMAGLGWDVSAAGDYDGDTFDDVLVSAPFWDVDKGAVLLLYGRATPPASMVVPGDRSTGFVGDRWFLPSAAGGQFGGAVAAGYRINSDTFDDVVIGQSASSNGGSVYLSFGRARSSTSGLVEVTTFEQQIVSPVAGTNIFFGNRPIVTDWNGDGRPDLLVYMSRPPGASDTRGGVMAYLNSAGSLPGAYSGMLLNDLPANSGDRFGMILASGWFDGSAALSDIDGDGRSDMLVGMSKYGGAGGAGLLFVGRDLTTTVSESTADYAVRAVAGDTSSTGGVGFVGDVNDDGYPDFAVGQDRHSADRGRITMVY